MPEQEKPQVIGTVEYEHLRSLTVGHTRKFLRIIETNLCRDMQVEANKALKRHEDRKAGEFLAKLEGIQMLLRFVKDKVDQYEKERD